MSNDTYSCFAELKKHEDENFYNIIYDMKNRSNVYAIMAPHGGKIELGTTEVSIAIARDDLSLYIFNANKPNNNKTLHITSSRFDEPHCEMMLKNVETVLAIHGAADPENGPKEIVWVGGNLSAAFEINLKETLQPLGILVEINHRFTGNSPENICNRGTSQHGMQLELTKSLREKLRGDAQLLSKFSDAVRTAMIITYPES